MTTCELGCTRKLGLVVQMDHNHGSWLEVQLGDILVMIPSFVALV